VILVAGVPAEIGRAVASLQTCQFANL